MRLVARNVDCGIVILHRDILTVPVLMGQCHTHHRTDSWQAEPGVRIPGAHRGRK